MNRAITHSILIAMTGLLVASCGGSVDKVQTSGVAGAPIPALAVENYSILRDVTANGGGVSSYSSASFTLTPVSIGAGGYNSSGTPSTSAHFSLTAGVNSSF